MVLIAEAQRLKAKLMLKGKYRPEAMVRPKMPDGHGMLAAVPQRRQGGEADAAAADDEEFLSKNQKKQQWPRSASEGPSSPWRQVSESSVRTRDGGVIEGCGGSDKVRLTSLEGPQTTGLG